METKIKLRKGRIAIVFAMIIILIGGIIGFTKYQHYRNSFPYQLKQLGYNESERETILALNQSQIKQVLNLPYQKRLVELLNQTYFLFENLDRYLAYAEKNADIEAKKIISLVNVNADYEHYTQTKKTDMSKGYLILVNKYHYLDAKYAPDDIIPISVQYAYDDNETRKEVYDAFKSMWYAANKEGLTLIVNSSYRSHDWQDSLYKSYTYQQGQAWADSVAARPGFSEHQTGLALDITTYNTTFNEFEATDEFKWLSKNAHKYGFILRYPKGKTDITGYDYESWHYRYVGVDVATEIYQKQITFDEYYAYYLK